MHSARMILAQGSLNKTRSKLDTSQLVCLGANIENAITWKFVESMGMDSGEEEVTGQKICVSSAAKRKSFVEGNPPLLAARPWFSILQMIEMVHRMQEAIGE